MDITGVSGSSSNLFSSFVDNPDANLGKNDFLELLVTKLRYQDPLKPMTDESFIADMAQFSSLEQMTNLNTGFSSQAESMESLNTNLVALIMMQNTTQAAGLIGKSVLIKHEVTQADGTSTTEEITGNVDVVKFVDGQPKIGVGGTLYSISEVSEIRG